MGVGFTHPHLPRADRLSFGFEVNQMRVVANQTARRAEVVVSPAFLASILRLGNRVDGVVCTKGVPPDAILVGTRIDSVGNIVLTFEHESFPEVSEGSPIAVPLAVEFSKVYSESEPSAGS